MNSDVALNLLYSGLGWVLGYLMGRIGRKVTAGQPRARDYRTWVGVLILVLTAYTVISGVASARNNRTITECQAAVNSQLIDATRQRAKAAAIERDGQRALLRVQIDPAATPAQRQNAIRQYLASLDASDVQRDAAPLPGAPRCGD